MRLLKNLGTGRKLTLLIISLTVPVAVLTSMLVVEQNIAIDFARKEIMGVTYLSPLRGLLQAVVARQSPSAPGSSDEATVRDNQPNPQAPIDHHVIENLDALDSQYGAILQTADSWRAIRQEWADPKTRASAEDADARFARHARLTTSILDLIAQVGDSSNLILDPDLDSYYLMDVAVVQLPSLLVELGRLRDLAARDVTSRASLEQEKLQLIKLAENIQVRTQGIQRGLNKAFAANSTLGPRLETQSATFAALSKDFIGFADRFTSGGESLAGPANELLPSGNRAIEAGFKLNDTVAIALRELLERRIDHFQDKQSLSLAGIGFCLIVALGLAYGISASITKPLRKAIAVSDRIAHGDLTVRIQADSRDEAGQLLQAMQTMVGQLRNTVSHVTQATGTVNSAAAEIAQGSADLAQRTEEQASALEETASSMEELTSTVQHSADHAGQANQLASAARAQAEQGGQVIEQAVSAMTAIHQSSQKIADIIGVIDEIAFQTNLLALNAAVEAARAGEQGRSFAVVASEVRKLAQRSADAAKEIKSLITDSVGKVEDGGRLVERSGQTLAKIVVATKKVSDIVAEMAAASREQATGIEQVNKAILQMDQVTQQNAALVEQTAAASHAMGEQARELQRLMAFFRLDDQQTWSDAPATDTQDVGAGLAQPRIAHPARHRHHHRRTGGHAAA